MNIFKFLKKININEKTENILVGTFFVLICIACIFINRFYKEAKLDEQKQSVTNSIYATNNLIFNYIYNNEKELNAIAFAISEAGTIDAFDKNIDLFKEDFKYVDYIGILKNSVLVKDYFPNGSYNIDKDELELSFIKLASSTNQYGSDTSYFVDKDDNLCFITKQPIYYDFNGQKQYYGEILFRCNLTNIMKLYFKPNAYKVNFDKEPWKFSLQFKNGIVLDGYSNISSVINNPYEIKFTHGDLNYIYTVSKDLIENLDNTNIFRISLMIFVVALLSFGLKTLFVIFRKQTDIDRINDTKLDFFTNIVYEVRTSTNSIIGFCNEMEKEVLNNNTKGYVNSSKDELKKLLHKINNLLDITNIVENKLNTYEEEYYVHMLVQEVAEEYKTEIESKDLKFIIDIDDNLPIKFKGAKTIIRKSLYHLLDNSLSTIIDGHIKISVSGKYLNEENKIMNLKIIVSDTGIGIKSEDIKDILLIEKLKDTSTSDDNRVELAIASELLKTANGTLQVTSEYGKGTICTISIMQKVIDDRVMTDEMLAGLQEKFRRNLGKLRKVHANILIVDDNEVNLSVLKNIIKIYGAEVDLAKSGVVAAELAQIKNYDMIFIDYLMPDLDGLETLKRLRQINKKYRSIPCILVTANTFSKEEEFRDAGFDEYLAKPIVQKDIERILKTLLSVELIECDLPETF